MLKPDLIKFYDRYTAKAETYQQNDLANIFDKFSTLFELYNKLYNEVPMALTAQGKAIPKKSNDNILATEFVVQYLGADFILQNFSRNNNDKDINAIIQVIDQELFHINLKNGDAQRDLDLIIMNNLSSLNNEDKAKAILQAIYYVRCNLFHGHKGFEEHQRMLVEPLANLLSTLTVQLFTALNK